MATGPDNPRGIYEGKVRVRACGLLEQDNKLLLLQVHSPVTDSLIWIPPGGGVEMGESLSKTVKREFKEETGLEVTVHNLLHINELIEPPFHAVELYFRVKKSGGSLTQGFDPEHSPDAQLIRDIGFFSEPEIKKMKLSPEYLKSAYWK